jgi:hypothetical protein
LGLIAQLSEENHTKGGEKNAETQEVLQEKQIFFLQQKYRLQLMM